MIVVTGSHGFIGSNFVKHLNRQGITDIIVSDYITNGRQFNKLDGTTYTLYIHPDSLMEFIANHEVDVVYHFGGISSTTEWNGDLVMERNTKFTIDLIDVCRYNGTYISYASSGSVYGTGSGPLNLYAYSKYAIDKYVKSIDDEFVQGFRYFNVYAHDDSESHKGNQASPFYKFKQQALEKGRIEVFEGSREFYRDFVDVNVVCEIQYKMKEVPGIFDLGTGIPRSFYDIAEDIACEYGVPVVEIPFPPELKGTYQNYTKADMRYLRKFGM